jgi:uncharacterized protein
MKNPVNWFEIYVQDMNRAKKFYESVLGVKLEKMDVPTDGNNDDHFQMVAFPMVADEPNTSGALVKAMGMSSGGNSVVIYFTCDDCSVEQSRIAESGGTILNEKFSIGDYGYVSICQDTEGNTFGLHSMQ